MKISREEYKKMNETILNSLKNYIKETNVNEGYCYLVKNVSKDGDICFVHQISKNGRSFKNIELSLVPVDVKIGDVLINDGEKFIIDIRATERVKFIKDDFEQRAYDSQDLFTVEGKKYMVCDKSDDDIVPQMSIKDFETGLEMRNINISKELYHKIKYGMFVIFENGEYNTI